VHFTINEIPHVVRRNAKSAELTLKVGGAEFVKAREADVRELLPVQAYSQKQLSSVSVRIDELTRFVESPIRRNLATIDRGMDEAAARMRENYATVQRHRQLRMAIQRLELTEKSLAEQATTLRASLEDVSDDDRKILDDKPKYDSALTRADAWHTSAVRGLEGAERLHGAVDDLLAAVQPAIDPPIALDQPLAELEANALSLLGELGASLSAAVDTLRAGVAESSDHDRLYAKIRSLVDEFSQTYSGVKSRSTAHFDEAG
jgi:hypothetical protein